MSDSFLSAPKPSSYDEVLARALGAAEDLQGTPDEPLRWNHAVTPMREGRYLEAWPYCESRGAGLGVNPVIAELRRELDARGR
ncbi:MAG: hypothetical protein JWP86_1053 [Phenylobacterium sp.]|nr:hypothetical protein [Phenylobacterium sp.]